MQNGVDKKTIRTCVACRTRLAKKELDRYVWDASASKAVLDNEQTMLGRGAYCCPDVECRKRFLGKKQCLQRAFRLR